jgi:hypothetical protein
MSKIYHNKEWHEVGDVCLNCPQCLHDIHKCKVLRQTIHFMLEHLPECGTLRKEALTYKDCNDNDQFNITTTKGVK